MSTPKNEIIVLETYTTNMWRFGGITELCDLTGWPYKKLKQEKFPFTYMGYTVQRLERVSKPLKLTKKRQRPKPDVEPSVTLLMPSFEVEMSVDQATKLGLLIAQ